MQNRVSPTNNARSTVSNRSNGRPADFSSRGNSNRGAVTGGGVRNSVVAKGVVPNNGFSDRSKGRPADFSSRGNSNRGAVPGGVVRDRVVPNSVVANSVVPNKGFGDRFRDRPADFSSRGNSNRGAVPRGVVRDSVVPNSVVPNNGFGDRRAVNIERGRTSENSLGVSRPQMNTQHEMNNQSVTRNNMGFNSSSNRQFDGKRFSNSSGTDNHRFFGSDHRKLFHPIVSPRDRCKVDFHHGRHVFHRHFSPFFHRKDIFVSFNGFWPNYNCLRYYWYGYQPYYWYGYAPYVGYGYGSGYPMTYDTGGKTYNYYTYNYGDSNSVPQTPPAIEDESYPPANPPEEQQIDKGPAPQTSTDQLFDEAVNAFGTGDYSQAADKLAVAIEQSPNDIVMPFAYVQALFAQCKYPEAAAAFRSAIVKASAAQKGQPQVFFPHGLYTNDAVLNQQIKALQDVVQDDPRNTDFQLMLGYQLLGAGRAGEAVAPLQAAQKDTANIAACNTLLELTQKINNQTPADAVK